MLATLSALLLVATGTPDRTVWLVQPLYPGQEGLVLRTEQALDKLILAEARANELIGRSELAAALKNRAPDASCALGESACRDPLDAFVASLGFDRILMVKGGQDETGYHFKVTSYRPASGETAPGEATSASLQDALMGALVKVAPVAANLEVSSSPPGAVVFVDEVRVGVTPLTTQVLPGERHVRLDLKLHQSSEATLVVPVRGALRLDRSLEKVAAQLSVTARPAGVAIHLDGELIGHDRIDRGIRPGEHALKLTADGHQAVEQRISVKPEESYVFDRTLEPVPGAPLPPRTIVIKEVAPVSPVVVARPAQPPAPAAPASPPPTPSAQERIYGLHSYFQVAYEGGAVADRAVLNSRRFGDRGTGRTADFAGSGRLHGLSLEYGTFGEYFGLSAIAIQYAQSAQPWHFPVLDPEVDADGKPGPTEIDAQVQLLSLRLLQPQVRVVLWRFALSVQAGVELRGGRILETGTPFYQDGFAVGGTVPFDVLLGGRLSLRGYLVGGLYLEASYAKAWTLTQVDHRKSGNSQGFNAGVGYAF